MKKCSKCKISKDTSEFYKDNSKKDGLRSHCKDCVKQYKKQYNQDNKEVINQYKKRYYQDNKEIIIKKDCSYQRKRYNADPAFRLLNKLRTRLKHAVNNHSKAATTKELIGCDMEFLLAWLNMTAVSRGYKNFNSKNYSGKDYHIDHKTPCASFDLSKPEEQKKCFHWTNLQILTAKENLIKGADNESSTT
ncbi:MAG TPA: hypothetical protein VMV86_02765 [Methanosarcinales archaeon]|nr:hypothetical protein [Methanosarcinales archaeon]